MIRIARTTEPPALAIKRAEKLLNARQLVAQGRAVDIKEYDVAKPALFEMQHQKCCYCEQRIEQAKYRDVEHYRPKSEYWWLAWTWSNLLFACFECNRENKRDKFPLEVGSTKLVAEQFPPGGELPLVLDPSDPGSDPIDQIEFRRQTVQGRERWSPVPRGGSRRGAETIAVCGLDRAALLDLYTDHVLDYVRPKLTGVFQALKAGDARVIREAWSSAARRLLSPGLPFRALSYDAMIALVPSAERTEYRLTLTRP